MRCKSIFSHGFTLIELLVVLAIVALMMTIAAPRTIAHVERSKEVALRATLKEVRRAVDQFEADNGSPPPSLEELVTQRYLNEVPLDPITRRRDSWVVTDRVAPSDERLAESRTAAGGVGIGEIHSGAPGVALDGTRYTDW
jgi:general secretion pathway protein G